jgi:predicted nucleotidyltransferase
MVQIPAEIKHIIDRNLLELNRHNIPISEAVLFGSYAKGNYHEWSDIALVSEIFTGDRIDDKDKIGKITLSVSSRLEVISFTLSDFNQHNPLAKEILKTRMKL